jgi:signal transduction histidine kinase
LFGVPERNCSQQLYCEGIVQHPGKERANVSKPAGQHSHMPQDVIMQLRALAHDLSNSIETILQAGYLLGQAKLDPNHKKWVQLIDTASQDAAKINRQIRDILRSQS